MMDLQRQKWRLKETLVFFKIAPLVFIIYSSEFFIGLGTFEIPLDIVWSYTLIILSMSSTSSGFSTEMNFPFRKQKKVASIHGVEWICRMLYLQNLVFCQKLLFKKIGFVIFFLFFQIGIDFFRLFLDI